MASIAAFQPVPSLAIYAATKACTVAIGITFGRTGGYRCLNYCVVPGRYCYQYGGHRPGGGLKFPDFFVGDVQHVAAGATAPASGRRDLCPRAVNLAATLTGRAAPKWLLRRISGVMARYTLNKK